MANIGRFLCVALPFILTGISLISLLIACLGGVTTKDLYMFQVNVTDLQVNPVSIKSIITRDIVSDVKGGINQADDAVDTVLNAGITGSNVTAGDLGLADVYMVNLWGYCTLTLRDGKKECKKPKFDWASETLNTSMIKNLAVVAGKDIDIPDEVQKGLDAFKVVTKWTEVAYIIALISLAVQLLFGLFTSCSRGISCLVWLVAGVSCLSTMGAASLSTAMSVVVVGTVESTAKFYGVRANFQTTFLGLVWTSVAFALAAAFFWMFTVCCCKPEKSSRKSKYRGSSSDKEKLIGGSSSYQPLSDSEMSGGNNPNYYQPPSYGAPKFPGRAPRSDLAYEPFSHR
jgi:hypothetical protein